VSALLISDQEREYTVGLLREHWLTGRLTADEFEQRVTEACAARFSADLWHALRWLPVEQAPARSRGSGATALVLTCIGWCIMLFTIGFGSPIALPLFISGWLSGRRARRSIAHGTRTAAVGEAFGIAGTLACLLFIAGCAAIVT
jgi:hypothetical protein